MGSKVKKGGGGKGGGKKKGGGGGGGKKGKARKRSSDQNGLSEVRRKTAALARARKMRILAQAAEEEREQAELARKRRDAVRGWHKVETANARKRKGKKARKAKVVFSDTMLVTEIPTSAAGALPKAIPSPLRCLKLYNDSDEEDEGFVAMQEDDDDEEDDDPDFAPRGRGLFLVAEEDGRDFDADEEGEGRRLLEKRGGGRKVFNEDGLVVRVDAMGKEDDDEEEKGVGELGDVAAGGESSSSEEESEEVDGAGSEDVDGGADDGGDHDSDDSDVSDDSGSDDGDGEDAGHAKSLVQGRVGKGKGNGVAKQGSVADVVTKKGAVANGSAKEGAATNGVAKKGAATNGVVKKEAAGVDSTKMQVDIEDSNNASSSSSSSDRSSYSDDSDSSSDSESAEDEMKAKSEGKANIIHPAAAKAAPNRPKLVAEKFPSPDGSSNGGSDSCSNAEGEEAKGCKSAANGSHSPAVKTTPGRKLLLEKRASPASSAEGKGSPSRKRPRSASPVKSTGKGSPALSSPAYSSPAKSGKVNSGSVSGKKGAVGGTSSPVTTLLAADDVVKTETGGSEIDDLFAGKRKKKDRSRSPVQKKARRVDGEEPSLLWGQPNPAGRGRYTDDGLRILTENDIKAENANITLQGSCPFDCSCCY